MSDLLATPLEQRFARASSGDGAAYVGVIALGGGEARIREAARLARDWPHLQLLVTGAGGKAKVRSLIGHDIGDERLLIEDRARNTFQNAAFAGTSVDHRPELREGRWLLVTSAIHMPRSIGVFRKAGLAVDPWPIDNLAEAERAVAAQHEWLGLVWYWLLGRTSALFPGPDSIAP